jgi:hypothetical protein
MSASTRTVTSLPLTRFGPEATTHRRRDRSGPSSSGASRTRARASSPRSEPRLFQVECHRPGGTDRTGIQGRGQPGDDLIDPGTGERGRDRRGPAVGSRRPVVRTRAVGGRLGRPHHIERRRDVDVQRAAFPERMGSGIVQLVPVAGVVLAPGPAVLDFILLLFPLCLRELAVPERPGGQGRQPEWTLRRPGDQKLRCGRRVRDRDQPQHAGVAVEPGRGMEVDPGPTRHAGLMVQCSGAAPDHGAGASGIRRDCSRHGVQRMVGHHRMVRVQRGTELPVAGQRRRSVLRWLEG